MKKLNLAQVLLLVMLLFHQCSSDEGFSNEKVQFTFASFSSDNNGGRSKSIENVRYALATIARSNGDIVHQRVVLKVMAFGDGLITEPLALKPGSYLVKEFMLANDADDVLYATPLAGSLLAELVDHPLPHGFNVTKDVITNVEMQVVATEYQQPEDFGFASFKVGAITPFQIAVYEINASGAALIAAEASISKGSEIVSTYHLQAKVNLLGVESDEEAMYTLHVSKEGYTSYSKNFTISSLLEELEGTPLKVYLTTITEEELEITLQPGASDGKDAQIGNCIPCGYNNINIGNSTELAPIAWTNNGDISNLRGLVQFNLSAIPTGSVITSARLSLYHFTSPGNGDHSKLSGSNAALVERIISQWTENTVTWDTQPSTTSVNRVILPESVSDTQDYTDIDVTALVQDMISNPSSSYGFMLKMQTEVYYRRLIFASSDNPNASLHPKLVVKYKN